MINLKNLTTKQKSTLHKVLVFAEKNNYDTNELESFLEKNKWNFHSGSFKKCYRKNGLVIKFSYSVYGRRECAREYEQWLAIPKSLRKYFAKTIAYKNDILIQEAVKECNNPDDCKAHRNILDKYWKKLILSDTRYNHGHKSGELKFFDWVYYRIPEYIDSDKMLPGSKRRIINGL